MQARGPAKLLFAAGLSLFVVLSPQSHGSCARAADVPPPNPPLIPNLPNQPRGSRPVVYLCAGIAGEAAYQGGGTMAALAAVEYKLQLASTARLIFDPLDPKTGNCDVPESPEAPDAKHQGILVLTYGQMRTSDDNYIIFDRRAEAADIAVIFLNMQGAVVAQSPRDAERGAYLHYERSVNQIAVLGATAAALLANARNTDKTAAAAVSFFSGFSALKFPAYHQADAAYALLNNAAFRVACDVATQLHANGALNTPQVQPCADTP